MPESGAGFDGGQVAGQPIAPMNPAKAGGGKELAWSRGSWGARQPHPEVGTAWMKQPAQGGKGHIWQEQAQNPKRWQNLMHKAGMEALKEQFGGLDPNKAPGIGKKAKEAHGERLNENLPKLLESMKRLKCHPQPVRRACIPKDGPVP